MTNTYTAKPVTNGTRALEMEIRDAMDTVAELASMISLGAGSYNCEILSIEPPDLNVYTSINQATHDSCQIVKPFKSQVLPFKK
jgi:hypothetical protein